MHNIEQSSAHLAWEQANGKEADLHVHGGGGEGNGESLKGRQGEISKSEAWSSLAAPSHKQMHIIFQAHTSHLFHERLAEVRKETSL